MELMHYGVKGMKWGVRRYQNKDGTYTPEGKVRNLAINRIKKAAKTKDDVDSIIQTMSKKDRYMLNIENDEDYLTIEQGEHVVGRFLQKEGKTPVAFFDLLDDGNTLNVAVGTRNDKRFRNKGYASKCVKEGLDWYDKNKHKFDNKPIAWWAREDNMGSQKLAEKSGLKYKQRKTESDGSTWVEYIYE